MQGQLGRSITPAGNLAKRRKLARLTRLWSAHQGVVAVGRPDLAASAISDAMRAPTGEVTAAPSAAAAALPASPCRNQKTARALVTACKRHWPADLSPSTGCCLASSTAPNAVKSYRSSQVSMWPQFSATRAAWSAGACRCKLTASLSALPGIATDSRFCRFLSVMTVVPSF